MKNVTALLLIIILCGCSKEARLNTDNLRRSIKDSQNNAVSIDDIYSFISNEATKGIGVADCKIQPYVDSSSDTLMYILNYGRGKGWKILSSDKRTPAILAEGDRGSFVLNGENPGPGLWLQGVAQDMAIIRQAGDEELTFSSEEIAANRSFWTGEPSRVIDLPTIDDEGGHWEVTTSTTTHVYDSLDHMVPKWDQHFPYNTYCPLKSDGSGERAPAGCVAVAAAQVLFYLNKTLGIPEDMYSKASCIGTTEFFQQTFWDRTTDVWSSMREYYDPVYYYLNNGICTESILIAYVGDCAEMKYHNNGSYPELFTDWSANIFDAFDINYSKASYDENVVKTHLLASQPVIIKAYPALIPIPSLDNGHAFVIDGYKRTRTQYYSEYVWVPDDPSTFYDPTNQYASYSTVTYSAPEITGIKINWGWASQWSDEHLNDGWYTLTGGWHVHHSNGEEANYNYYRTMVYGFSGNN